MADIHPFRGIHYSPSTVFLEEVLAPPYNRITPQLHEELLGMHSYNAVRFTLTRNGQSYAYAASCFDALYRDGVLCRDNERAMYVLSQSYKDANGTMRQRIGVIALCRLEEFRDGGILPHLATLPRPREDRFRQIQAMNTNLTPVVALYSDQAKEIDRILVDITIANPMFEMTTEQIITRVWRVGSDAVLTALQQRFNKKQLVIADGHHMYEAALTYRDMMKLQRPAYTGREGSNHIMMFLTNMDSGGSSILPMHRLVNIPRGLHWDNFILEISKHFRVRALESVEQIHLTFARRTPHTICILHGKVILVAVLNSEEPLADLLGPGVPPEIRTLDATILHSYILEKLLGLDEHMQQLPECVRQTPDLNEVVQAVASGKTNIGFLLTPEQIGPLSMVARSGHQLPPRSTLFYPAIPSGLIMNRLDEPVP